MPQDDSFPVVVIGAGLAGLSAAVHLADRGVAPLVLDADRLWLGGRLSGGDPDRFTYNGRDWAFPTEHGVHAVWGNYVNMRAMLDRYLDLRLIESPGEEWINRWRRDVRVIEAGNAVRSKWLPAPFHYLQLLLHPQIWATITPLDFLSLPGYLLSTLWAVGFDPFDEQVALDGLTMREFFRGWTPNLKATFVGLGNNLLAAPSDDISLTAYIAALRFYTLLRRDSWRMHYFPDHPHACLLQPLADIITSKGGQIRQGVTATCLERVDGGWRITVEDSNHGGMRSLLADQIILATSAPAAQRLLCNSPAIAEQAAQLTFPDAVGNATVRLWFDAEPRPGTPGGMLTGDFVPDNFFWLHRLYNDFAVWNIETGGSVIELHLYANPETLAQPSNVQIITCVSEVQRAFPELTRHFVHGTVRLNSRNHTRLRIPAHDSLFVETPWDGISACGDWVGYATPSLWMERATVTGIAAANRVLVAQGSDPFEIKQPPPPEAVARVLGGAVRVIRRVLGPVVMGGLRGARQLRDKRRES